MKTTIKTGVVFLAAFILAAFLLSCDGGEEASGPIGPPNPNDPYPFWVANLQNDFAKYDRSGNRIASLVVDDAEGENSCFCFLNPCNGDLWFRTGVLHGTDYVRIYDRTGKYKKSLTDFDASEYSALDTNRRWVWFGDYDDVNGNYYLNRSSLAGGAATRFNIPAQHPWTTYPSLRIGVYDRTGDVWVLGFFNDDGELIKLNKDGGLLYRDTLSAKGIRGPYILENIFVDQTDGGVWITCVRMGGGYIQKINRDGTNGIRINTPGHIYDVSRSSGRVLINNYANRGLELYDKNGTMLWSKADYKQVFAGGIVDATGEVIAAYQKDHCLRIAKFDSTGKPVFEDIGVFAGGGSETAVFVHNAPYPY